MDSMGKEGEDPPMSSREVMATPCTIREMKDVFKPFIDFFVIVYLDDILVFSHTWKDHVMHVNKVLDVLKREKLCVNLSECEFGKISLVYLGYVVGNG
jgi:hypothetical protein